MVVKVISVFMLVVFHSPPLIKLTATIYITEILLKVALNTITLTLIHVIFQEMITRHQLDVLK
jgi:hypothetical protein